MRWDPDQVKEIWDNEIGGKYPGYNEACKAIDYLIKSDGYKSFDELYTTVMNLEEGNDTSAGGEYSTPNAFARTPKSEDDEEMEDKRINATGTYSRRVEQYLQKLVEIAYDDFKNDTSTTNKDKINDGIKNISKQLYEMERSVNQMVKLKTEIGADQSIFYKHTINRFNKINERLLKLSSKLREFNK